jgi:ribosomal protein S20
VVRRHRNLHVKRVVKQDIAAVHTALANHDAAEIQEKLNVAYSEIDRAVKKHTLHKNTAARRKSVLAHVVAKAAGAEAVPAETKTTKGAGKKAATAKTATKKPVTAKATEAKKPVAKKSGAKKATEAKKPGK